MKTGQSKAPCALLAAALLTLFASVLLQGCTGGGAGGYRDSGPPLDDRGS